MYINGKGKGERKKTHEAVRMTESTHENAQRKRPEEGGLVGGEERKKTENEKKRKKEDKSDNDAKERDREYQLVLI